LLGGACARCGYDACGDALHFHHVDPVTKAFSLGRHAMGRAWKTLTAEAAKCEVLCANCHAALEDASRRARVVIVHEPATGADGWCEKHGWRPTVLQGARRRCRTCRSEAVIEWYRRRKARLIHGAGGACSRCSNRVPAVAFHFHHRDRAAKSFNLSGPNLMKPWPAVAAEAAKCDLLCANCHAEVEASQAQLC
jgi:hypothetical protein